MSKNLASQRKLVYDVREAWLTEYLQANKFETCAIEARQLPVADFWVEELANPGVPIMMIERKTENDLAASIKDGRMAEQRQRMVDSGVPCLYLIEWGTAVCGIKYSGLEGTLPHWTFLIQTVESMRQRDPNAQFWADTILPHLRRIEGVASGGVDPGMPAFGGFAKIGGLDQSILRQTIVNTALRDRIPCIRVYSKGETLAFLENIAKAKLEYSHSVDVTRLRATMPTLKKPSELSQREVTAQMLERVTGISAEKALVIVKEYPSMEMLVQAFKDADNDKDLPVQDLKDESGRRIGPERAKRLRTILLTQIEQVEEAILEIPELTDPEDNADDIDEAALDTAIANALVRKSQASPLFEEDEPPKKTRKTRVAKSKTASASVVTSVSVTRDDAPANAGSASRKLAFKRKAIVLDEEDEEE